jgi:hypothetical protein
VDVIKMDIQGAELSALRGAERVLTENRNVRMVLEYWPYGLARAGDSAEELLRFLASHGFRYRLTDGARAESVGTGADEYANLIAEHAH